MFCSLSFERATPVFASEEPVAFDLRMRAREVVDGVRVSGTIFHAEGYPIGSFFSPGAANFSAGEERTFRLNLASLNLSAGSYSFSLATGVGDEATGHRDFDIVTEVLPFEIAAAAGEAGTVATWSPHWGAIRFESVHMREVSGNGN